MYCKSCGTELPGGALFCHQCGAKQIKEPVSPDLPPDGPKARRILKGLYFLDNWLALVALAVLATITMTLYAVGSNGFTTGSAAAILQQFCLVGMLAVSAMVSTRTGGLDLSAGAMMALSAMILALNASAGNAWAGFLLSVVICGVLGLLNGLFIFVLRIPAIWVTIASAMLIRGIGMWASDGRVVEVPAEWTEMSGIVPLLALIVSVAIAVLLLWRTGRFAKEPKNIHGSMRCFWIYGVIAMIGMLGGWAAAVCFGNANASIGSGSSNEMILLFVSAMISASAMVKKNWVALVWALLIAILWTMHDQAMILLQLTPFSWIVSNASWVFIMLAVMAIARRSWQKPVGAMLNPQK